MTVSTKETFIWGVQRRNCWNCSCGFIPSHFVVTYVFIRYKWFYTKHPWKLFVTYFILLRICITSYNVYHEILDEKFLFKLSSKKNGDFEPKKWKKSMNIMNSVIANSYFFNLATKNLRVISYGPLLGVCVSVYMCVCMCFYTINFSHIFSISLLLFLSYFSKYLNVFLSYNFIRHLKYYLKKSLKIRET